MHHLGWTYSWNDDHSDDDVRKIEHVATHDDGREVVMDLSPYYHMHADVFHYMVELGFPRRTGIGPLRDTDVLRMWINRLEEKEIEECLTPKPKVSTTRSTSRKLATTFWHRLRKLP